MIEFVTVLACIMVISGIPDIFWYTILMSGLLVFRKQMHYEKKSVTVWDDDGLASRTTQQELFVCTIILPKNFLITWCLDTSGNLIADNAKFYPNFTKKISLVKKLYEDSYGTCYNWEIRGFIKKTVKRIGQENFVLAKMSCM